MPPQVTLIGIESLPEVRPGDDLARLIVEAAERQVTPLASGDLLVVTQKVVSKAEGRLVRLAEVSPSPRAVEAAKTADKDPRLVEVVLREARRIVRMERGVIITETHHGFRCANSGVDASNVGPDAVGPDADEVVSLLPEDSDASARRIRQGVRDATGAQVAVLISDTFGRPWREGAANVAIGVAGMEPLLDYRGQRDLHGHELQTTVIAVADELAAAAELVTNKLTRVPAAIVRGYPFQPGESGIGPLIRDASTDLFQ